MEQREVLVTLISARDLKKVTLFLRATVYGVVWIYPNMKVSSPVDTRGHLNPTWDTTLRLSADERLLQSGNALLHIDLYDYGSSGSTHVGSCVIPLTGLTTPVVDPQNPSVVDPQTPTVVESQGTLVEARAEDKPVESSSANPNVMTVPVLRRSGRARGFLNVSVRLGELTRYPEYPQPQGVGQDAPVYAYPPGYDQYPGAGRPYYPVYQQAPYQPYGGYGRSGLGTGLLAGGLGGLLLGSLLGGGCGGF